MFNKIKVVHGERSKTNMKREQYTRMTRARFTELLDDLTVGKIKLEAVFDSRPEQEKTKAERVLYRQLQLMAHLTETDLWDRLKTKDDWSEIIAYAVSGGIEIEVFLGQIAVAKKIQEERSLRETFLRALYGARQ